MSHYSAMHLKPEHKMTTTGTVNDGQGQTDKRPYVNLTMSVWHDKVTAFSQLTLYTTRPEDLDNIAAEATKAAAALRQLIDPAPAASESAPCPVCSRELMPGEPCPACTTAPQTAVNAPGSPIMARTGYCRPVAPIGDPNAVQDRATTDFREVLAEGWNDSVAKLNADYPDTSADL